MSDSKGNPSVVIEWEESNQKGYDESNRLVVLSKKKKTKESSSSSKAKTPNKKNKNTAPTAKFLSKKQRKKLEKIVERRTKKKNRAELIEELQKYQLPQDVFNTLTPYVKIQTDGIRKLFKDEVGKQESDAHPKTKFKGSLKGANRSVTTNRANLQKYLSKDPKVLGFDEPSSDESTSEDDEPNLQNSNENTEMLVPPEIKEELPDIEMLDNELQEQELQAVISSDQSETTAEKLKEESNPSANKGTEDKQQPVLRVRIPSKFVQVTRSEEIESVRAKLPIIAEEQVIMEAIKENSIVVLAGETGCGKTTQIPQFLYEAGYALNDKVIGVTEPRRVAAMAMSCRVGKELNLPNDIVSYQIRFEGNATERTRVKFMTDGVLLKEMERDFLLKKYSVICIDEAHERSLFTDILIGLLSRCVKIREKRDDPLKVVIMSATLRAEDFLNNTKLFKLPPAFIHVPARQYPVQVHFSKVTPEDYIEAAKKKVVSIHTKLPPGGILVFVTGQLEVKILSKKLQELFNKSEKDSLPKKRQQLKKILKRKITSNENITPKVIDFDLDEVNSFPYENESDEEHLSDQDEEEIDISIENPDLEPLHVVPLYSMLPLKQQQKVFLPPPKGSRLCVVATNIAETSLTIPSVRYVVDCGKTKEKQWDKLTGIQTFQVCWCSKASAQQRSGRAGRTGPGHSYRLYSSAVFNNEFSEYAKPEIQIRPVDDMVLLMKSMAINKVRNFPYPSSPGDLQIVAAEKLLIQLGALEVPKEFKFQPSSTDLSVITSLGKTMAHLPVSPRFSKMIAISFTHSMVEHIVNLVAALTVQEVLLEATEEKDAYCKWTQMRKKWAKTGSSLSLGDYLVLLRSIKEFEDSNGSVDSCYALGLRHKAMIEIRKLRKQLSNEINILAKKDVIYFDQNIKLPNDNDCNILRQIILSGSPDKIAKKLDQEELTQAQLKNKNAAYWCGEVQEPVFIHSASVLRGQKPDWIVYQEAYEINGKVYLRGVAAIDPSWIPHTCPLGCNLGLPLKEPPPFFDSESGQVKCYVESTYGRQAWKLPMTTTEYPTSLDKYKLFAEYFLSGQVFTTLEKWKGSLLSLPSNMTKSWARLVPRTQTFLQTLLNSKIDSRQSLLNKWNQDNQFLLQAYLEWLPETLHSEVSNFWPPEA